MSPESTPLLAALQSAAQRNADRVAIASAADSSLTHAQLSALLADGIRQLNNLGVHAGVAVAVHTESGFNGILVQLLCMAGATAVPLNPACTHAEIRQQIHGTGAALLVTDSKESCTALCEAMELPGIAITLDANRGRFMLAPLQAPQNGLPADAADIALILHTSGSTGTPKAVPLTSRMLHASARNIADSLQLGTDDTGLNMLPQFHVGALVDLLLAPLIAGGGVIVAQRFDAREFFRLTLLFPITWFQGVPTMLQDLLDHAAREDLEVPQRLRLIRSVSSALPPELGQQLEQAFSAPVIEIYGMSETTGLIAGNPLPPAVRKPGSVGRPHGPEVRISAGTGDIARIGERGEIQVRGDTVMNGYLGSDGEEFVDGWLRTGDEGYLDADGFLTLSGRIKETINRGGEKISPLQIDHVAAQHPAVVEAAAFSVRHRTLGEEIALAVVARPGLEIDAASLQVFMRERVAAFKVPRQVFFIDSLPRAPGGKLQRHLLAQACSAQPDAQKPVRTLEEDERRLAKLWEDVLGVAVNKPDANFFDLGGDSLKAIWLIEELNERGMRSLTGADLYLHPTVASLSARLRQPAATADATASDAADDALSAELVATVRAYLQGWKGSKRSDDALLTGRHTEVSGVPLFWCMNAAAEFDALANALGPERPLYGMRTLYQVPDRHPRHVPILSDRYLEEIEAIQPSGPYLLGGFCEGAKFALHMAQRLREKGQEVALLAMQEQFVPEYYEGPTAFYVCPDRKHGWARYFVDPEHAWRAMYTGPLRINEMNHDHDDSYQPGHVESFAGELRRDIDAALGTGLVSGGPPGSMQALAPEAMRAELTMNSRHLRHKRRQAEIAVHVRNIGTDTWLPTSESRIMLGCRWLKNDLTPRHDIAGHTELPRPLKPGASIELPLRFRTPNKISWRKLQIDMFQDGIAWFTDAGSELVVRRVLVC